MAYNILPPDTNIGLIQEPEASQVSDQGTCILVDNDITTLRELDHLLHVAKLYFKIFVHHTKRPIEKCVCMQHFQIHAMASKK